MIVAGDSAGGHLALTLLLAARDSKLPLPGLAIALSPATDFENARARIVSNQESDWIDRKMFQRWADWFCDSIQSRDPLVSLLAADLRGLPPMYIQAGDCEILYGSIQAFADRARSQGAEIVLETWKGMNHVFQMFGPDVSQSAEALRRIEQVIDSRVRGQKEAEAVSS
jgi:acetyl esterase/lipase